MYVRKSRTDHPHCKNSVNWQHKLDCSYWTFYWSFDTSIFTLYCILNVYTTVTSQWNSTVLFYYSHVMGFPSIHCIIIKRLIILYIIDYMIFFLRWSQVMMEEMSFQVSLENCQGFCITDEGGKFIPPARNGEWKRSGERFCASLWWHHEATLARRSDFLRGCRLL